MEYKLWLENKGTLYKSSKQKSEGEKSMLLTRRITLTPKAPKIIKGISSNSFHGLSYST